MINSPCAEYITQLGTQDIYQKERPTMILQDLRYLEVQKHLDECYDVKTGEIQIRLPVKPKKKYERPHRRAGTFGAASECKVLQISEEMRQESLECLGEAQAKQTKREPLALSLQREALRDAHINWLNVKCHSWPLAVSLHFPSNLAHMKATLPIAVIEKKLDLFFKKMEKRLFGGKGRDKRQTKLSRLVVVEKSANVGFHIHMAMRQPVGMQLWKFIEFLKNQWNLFWSGQAMTFSNERAAWVEAMSGRYVKYSLKNIGTEHAEVLWCSSHF